MSRLRERQAGRAPAGHLHGVLVIDKPRGPTSHDVVASVRRAYGTRRVGHAGTLDPMATGVLVVLLGEATKLSAYLTRDVKRYRAEVTFGSATHTLDAEGTVTRVKALEPGWLDEARLTSALEAERARRVQIPPQVSAIKVGGQAAHALTRRGEAPDLAPRDVAVHELLVTGRGDKTLEVELLVSKGYYVRAFARDLGEALGYPAHLSALRRLASGPFTLEGAVAPPEREARPETLPVPTALYDVAVRALSSAELTPAGLAKARDGKRLVADEDWGALQPARLLPVTAAEPTPHAVASEPADPAPGSADVGPPSDAPLLALTYRGTLIALAALQRDGTLQIARGFHDPNEGRLAAPHSVG